MRVTMIGSLGRKAAAYATGVTNYVDYRDGNAADQAGALEPDGYDIVIDAVGQADTADAVLPLVTPGGTLGIYGVDEFKSCQIHPHYARGSFTFYNGGYDEAEAHHQVITMIRDGRLDAEVWLDLDHIYPLEQIQGAFDAVRERRAIKTLVKLTCD
jgi:threonine dehydrogenase-like Zn-dependent dehydrogenase